MAECVRAVLDNAGRIDVLVNNAEVVHEGIAEETTIAEAEILFATNLFGTARVVNAVLPSMRERRRGRIVNIGSLAAWIGEPGEGFYTASKATLARYIEALRPRGPVAGHLGVPDRTRRVPHRRAQCRLDHRRGHLRLRRRTRGGHRTLHQSMRKGGDPRTVAELIAKTAQARTPRTRCGSGNDGLWIPYLTTLLPQRLVEYLLRRAYGLPPSTATTRPR